MRKRILLGLLALATGLPAMAQQAPGKVKIKTKGTPITATPAATFAAGITPEELEFISSALVRSMPLGSLTFKENLERTTQRQILPAKRGRPFKQLPV